MSLAATRLRLGARLLAAQRRSLLSTSSAAKPEGPPRVPPPPPAEEAVETIEISTETHLKNGVMAAALFSFCIGVAWYSMNAVGQAGDAGSDDPLASLRQEAAAAKDKQDREQKSTDEAADMMKKFQAGDFDPDKLEELEEEENSKPKKPWWKVW